VRILHLTEAFTGGVFTSVTRLATGLAKRGHEVHIAYARRPETPPDIGAVVPREIGLHELRLVRAIDPRADIAGLLAVRRLLASLRPDVIHLHSSKAGVLGRVAAWTTGDAARTFYSPRGLAFLQENYSPLARRLFELVERVAALLGGTIVACSASEEALVRNRIRPRLLTLVENAIDVDAVPRRVPRDGDTVCIGAVGRITYQNNPDLFAAIAHELAGPGVHFRWIGGGEDSGRATLESANVEVTGWLPRPEALAAISRLDICLHPTRWEGMPIALIESQVAGLPAVTTDAVGNRDVVRHGETGFVGKGHEDLVKALRSLIADPALRSRMGDRAREVAVERFRLDRMLDDYERVYSTAAARSSP
jgi:glycosyltransferase involved in cell wall biosynthesis